MLCSNVSVLDKSQIWKYGNQNNLFFLTEIWVSVELAAFLRKGKKKNLLLMRDLGRSKLGHLIRLLRKVNNCKIKMKSKKTVACFSRVKASKLFHEHYTVCSNMIKIYCSCEDITLSMTKTTKMDRLNLLYRKVQNNVYWHIYKIY